MAKHTAASRTAARRTRTWYDSPWKIAAQAVSLALGAAVVVAVLAIVVVPRVTGGSSFTVLTGSMVPTFSPGDVVVDRGIDEDDVCRDVSVGTIVTYLPEPDDPALITHRVIGKTIGDFPDGTDCRIITQGDANSAVDEPVSPAQVRGVFMFGIPKLGWVRQWVAGNMQTVGVVVVVGLLAWWFLGGRRSKTRIVSVAGAGRAGAGAGGDAATAAARFATERDRELLSRELDLRERELAVRERELDRRDAGPDTLATVPVPARAIRILPAADSSSARPDEQSTEQSTEQPAAAPTPSVPARTRQHVHPHP